MICSRRLYKGNTYEICLPLTDTGVTLVRFYTRGDVIIEKEPEITGDSMCFSFTEEEIASLEDGVLRYEIVTEYETTDTNSPYVIATPGDYSGSTLDDLLEDAFDSGYTAGQEGCSGGTCEGVYESGYTAGYSSGVTVGERSQKSKMIEFDIYADDLVRMPGGYLENGFRREDGYNFVHVQMDTNPWVNSGYTSGVTDGYNRGVTDGYSSGYTSGYTDGHEGCSGYTQDDLDAAYASGWSAGYDSGLSVGCNYYITGTTDMTYLRREGDADMWRVPATGGTFHITLDTNCPCGCYVSYDPYQPLISSDTEHLQHVFSGHTMTIYISPNNTGEPVYTYVDFVDYMDDGLANIWQNIIFIPKE